MQLEPKRLTSSLLDLNMPDVDGTQLLREWSASSIFSGVPVLLVSASPELSEIAQRFEIKATLAKPFDMDEFGAGCSRARRPSKAAKIAPIRRGLGG
jgi:DNA-binding response OmpR family regulator